jgi:4-hydroxybenzoate polyprenyltransferase
MEESGIRIIFFGAFLLVAIITSFLAVIYALNGLPWKALTNGIFTVLFLETLYYLRRHEKIENKNLFGTICFVTFLLLIFVLILGR